MEPPASLWLAVLIVTYVLYNTGKYIHVRYIHPRPCTLLKFNVLAFLTPCCLLLNQEWTKDLENDVAFTRFEDPSPPMKHY